MNKPSITAGQWITLGRDPHFVHGVVSLVHEVGLHEVGVQEVGQPAEAEVVCMRRDGRAIREDIAWLVDHWEFAEVGSSGYAEKSERLAPYLQILRAGRRTEAASS